MINKTITNSNIAILTTVINFPLYEKTCKFFPQGIQKYVIDGSNGMFGIHSIYYMFEKLSNKNIDWLILADEDVIFNDANVVFSIIDKMIAEDYSVCGIRDGGVIKHRVFNPEMVNTFFAILNFKKIKEIWNVTEVKKNHYILPNEFHNDNIKLSTKYDNNSLYEPYYCFFLWLKRKNMKFLYLDAEMLNDNIANSIIYKGKIFAYHTWYARSYNINQKHTDRINKIMSVVHVNNSAHSSKNDVIIYKDHFFWFKTECAKLYKRIQNRLDIIFSK